MCVRNIPALESPGKPPEAPRQRPASISHCLPRAAKQWHPSTLESAALQVELVIGAAAKRFRRARAAAALRSGDSTAFLSWSDRLWQLIEVSLPDVSRLGASKKPATREERLP
jgi:hypothetical protein